MLRLVEILVALGIALNHREVRNDLLGTKRRLQCTELPVISVTTAQIDLVWIVRLWSQPLKFMMRQLLLEALDILDHLLHLIHHPCRAL